jgi:hypothetical protein
MEGNSTYYRRRAQEERAAAMKSAHPTARQSHLAMAARYDELAGQTGASAAPANTNPSLISTS